MKISSIQTHVLQYRVEEVIGSAYGWYETRECLLVEVNTDAGLTGWGEAHGFAHPAESVIATVLAPLALGRDPLDISPLWHEMYRRTVHVGQRGTVLCAMSAVDVALWDILGQAVSQPIFTLLGGKFREQAETYSMGLFYRRGEDLAGVERVAACLRDLGYAAIKMKVGGMSLKEDVNRVEVVRKAIGPDMQLMVDANRAYNAPAAVQVARAIEPYDILWFEEPVGPDDLAGYKIFKSAVSMLVAGGECVYTEHGFARLLGERCVDVVQPEVASAGGITVCRKVMDLAHRLGIFFVPHMHGSALTLAAGLQLVAAMPNVTATMGPQVPMIELDTTRNPLREELLTERIEPVRGKTRIPEKPGLGVQINRATVDKYQTFGRSLTA